MAKLTGLDRGFVLGAGETLIAPNTIDDSDVAIVHLCSGGDALTSRGGYLSLYGNQSSTNAGQAKLLSSSNIILNAGTDVQIQSPVVLAPSTGLVIKTDTSDGSDSSSINISGGGDALTSRGGYLSLYGNESTSYPGQAKLMSGTGVVLQSGDTLTALSENNLNIQSTSGDIYFKTSTTNKWSISNAGNLLPVTSLGPNIGASTQRVNIIHLKVASFKGSDATLNWQIDQGTSSSTLGVFHNLTTQGTLGLWSTTTGTTRIKCDGVTMNVPFTGTHIYAVKDGENLSAGDAVKLVNRELVKCTTANDTACVGFITDEFITTAFYEDHQSDVIRDSFGTEHRRVYDEDGITVLEEKYLHITAACGDSVASGLGGVKVCDEGGPVHAGDFLCTSNTPGFLMKQDSTIEENRTCAKAVEDVSFDSNGQAVNVYVFIKTN